MMNKLGISQNAISDRQKLPLKVNTEYMYVCEYVHMCVCYISIYNIHIYYFMLKAKLLILKGKYI